MLFKKLFSRLGASLVVATSLLGAATAQVLPDEESSGKGYQAKTDQHTFSMARGVNRVDTTPREWLPRQSGSQWKHTTADFNPQNQPDPGPVTQDMGGMFEAEAPPFQTGFFMTNSGSTPPDPMMAVGLSDVAAVVNFSLVIRDFDGNLISSTGLNTICNNSGDFVFDPHIRYDTFRNRFIGIAASKNSGTDNGDARWWIFYSDNSSAEGDWTAFSVNARLNGATDDNAWMDYPHLAVSDQAVCVAGIMFSNDATPSYGKVRFMDATDVYDGGGIGWYDNWNLSSDGTDDFRPVPVNFNSSTNSFWVLVGKEGGSSRVTAREYADSGTDFGNNTSLLATRLITVSAYAPAPDADQPSGVQDLDNIDCRIMQAEGIDGDIYAVQTVVANSRSYIRAYKFDAPSGATPTVTFSTTFGNSDFDYTYPGVTGTTDGDMVVVFCRSNSSTFAECRYTGKLSADTSLEGSALLKAGEGTYLRLVGSRNRWGDYLACALDPYDDRNVWFIGEYAESNNFWGTWVGSANYKDDYVVVANNANIATSGTGNLTANVKVNGVNQNGKFLYFYVNNVYVGADASDANGNSSLQYTVPSGTVPGPDTIRVDALRTTTINADSDTATLTVSKANSAIQITNEAGTPGEVVSFTIQLIRTTDSTGLSGKTVNVTVNGVGIGGAVTNASGFAQKSYTITNPVGVYNVTASFAGDTLYNSVSDNTGVLTVSKGLTNIAVPAVNGTIGSNAALTGTLTRTVDGLALSGRTLTFTVDGVGVGSAVTNASGLATLNWNVTAGVLGARTYSVSWLGDTQYNSDSTASTFNRYANTTLTVPAVTGQRTQNVVLSATLRRAHDSALITGQTVNFTVDGAGVGSAVTNGSGVASLNYVIPAGATFGAHPIGVTFPAAGFFNNSSGSGTLTVGLPSFNGNLTLLQWGGSNAVNAVVTVRNNANAIVQGPSTVATNVSGNWSLPTSLLPGTYRVTVKSSHWLSQRVLNVSLNNTTGTGTILHDLLNGDCDGNDIIDVGDYSILAAAFDALLDTDPGTIGNQSSPNWDIRADLNGDGIVDIADYSILAGNFDKFGDG
ncbi:MAG: hypothetical protein JNJ45_07180 [Chthonomonas sp.]|nr:hypothetical protein [Chthonomonas sp.]